MRDSLLAVEQLREVLLCLEVRQRAGMGYAGEKIGALSAGVQVVGLRVICNAFEHTRDMKALVICAQVIDFQCSCGVNGRSLDVGDAQTWQQAIKFRRGGGGPVLFGSRFLQSICAEENFPHWPQSASPVYLRVEASSPPKKKKGRAATRS